MVGLPVALILLAVRPVVGAVTLVALASLAIGAGLWWTLRRMQYLQRTLEVANRRNDIIFGSLCEGVALMDADLNIVYMNKAASRILGIPGPEMSFEEARRSFEARSIDGRILPEEEWPARLAQKGRFVHGFELRLMRRHLGDERFVEMTTTPIPERRRRAAQTVLTCRDVTETRRAAMARERLAAIVDCSEDAIIGEDLDGVITSWNRGAEKLFGYSAEEMLGQSNRKLLPDALQHEGDDILQRIRSAETVEHIETERLRKDGTVIQVAATISPIRGPFGEVLGASQIARDITERLRLERQVRQSQKLEALGQLTSGVAHDFNNLLGVIVGNLELLEEMLEDNEPALGRIRSIQRAAAREADLARRLQSFSSREDLSPSLVSLTELVQTTVDLSQTSLGADVRVVLHFDEMTPAVFVDASALQNAVINLLVNSRDAMPNGGNITITTQIASLDAAYPPVVAGELRAGSYVCLSVSDTGHGMSTEVQDHVFEPFFTTKSRDKGTGLGLAMVYGFARQSGGTVKIYSEQGYGTTVSIYLPVPKDREQVAPRALAPSTPEPFEGARVLVVDDEPEVLELAVDYLNHTGFQALAASSAEEAQQLVEDHVFDMIVTDIVLSGDSNGAELVHRIRKFQPQVKAVYCSGFPAQALIDRRLFDLDGPVVQKPYHRSQLMAAIREAQNRPVLVTKETR